MRVAYLDCFSGISGDMLLGAMLDVGLPLDDLRRELQKLPLEGYSITASRVQRGQMSATKAGVDVTDEQTPRTRDDVLRIIESSSLPPADRKRAAAVFGRLAEAEAAVHGEAPEAVRLHDVGAVDAIIDVTGAVAGMRMLGVEAIYCSALPLGEGEARGPHGVLPVPAPATLELVTRAGAPLRRGCGLTGELVTPTGAAIATTLARFERPEMTLERIGYGAGSADPADRPNVLRLWIGETREAGGRPMLLIETNIDDMTGEELAYALEKLLAAGAADAWLTPVQMKKGRPGVVLSLICSEPEEDRLARLILRETSTLGVRVRPVHRWEAEREVMEFESSLGPAAVKVKRLPGEPPRAAPEYEACKRLAEKTGLPLAQVYRIVQAEGEELVRQNLAGC